jgi:magnesium transporter
MIEKIASYYKNELSSNSLLSSYIEESDYQILILRGLAPVIDDISYSIECFLFSEGQTFKYDDQVKDFRLLKSDDEIYVLLINLTSKNRNIVQTFVAEIEDLEDSLYRRSFPAHFIDMWFDLRNEISKIDRYNQRLFESITDYFNSQKSPDLLSASQYKEIVSKIHFTQSKVKDEVSRLDTLHHYYTSIKGDRLNRSLFLLTIISGLFLPLNLVVGFFGMNTENLYLAGNSQGTNTVTIILLSIIAFQLFFVPVFKLLDRFFLRFMLGRIDLYKKLNKKFDTISQTFKVD